MGIRQFNFKPGYITETTARQLNEIQRWIERFEANGRGDHEQPTVERIRVKLTAQNGASPPVYTGTEQWFNGTLSPEDRPNGRTFSPTGMRIYERNGQTVSSAALSAGYHAWIDRRTLVDGTPYYEFDIGQGSGGTELKGLTFTSDTDSTADSDPGAGLFKWNHATQGSATVLYFDDLTADGIDVTTFFASLAKSGYLYLQQSDDSTIWQLWKWTNITDSSGYTKVTVVLQAKSTANIADAKTVYSDWCGSVDASATVSGLVNTTTQTIAGVKTFSDATNFPAGFVVSNGLANAFVTVFANATSLKIQIVSGGNTAYINIDENALTLGEPGGGGTTSYPAVYAAHDAGGNVRNGISDTIDLTTATFIEVVAGLVVDHDG